ncbi:hypothetical protein ABT324_07985 [Saccharopolyspora sp. NPDC000359]|uniref:hypothetical protein n=1 Tax=Saccharopolyspora sp. NPDC000359 TaxID=3154251 RepID=UPI0033196609
MSREDTHDHSVIFKTTRETMRKLGKKIAGAAATTAAVAGFAIAFSAPAQATAWDCQSYLQGRGYIIGPKVVNVCATTTNAPLSQAACWVLLVNEGVSDVDAGQACDRAAWGR